MMAFTPWVVAFVMIEICSVPAAPEAGAKYCSSAGFCNSLAASIAPAWASSNTALPRNFGKNTIFNDFPGVALTAVPEGAEVAVAASVAAWVGASVAAVVGASVAACVGACVAGGCVGGGAWVGVAAGAQAVSKSINTTPSMVSFLNISISFLKLVYIGQSYLHPGRKILRRLASFLFSNMDMLHMAAPGPGLLDCLPDVGPKN